MFDMYEKVKIKNNGIIGVVVDIYSVGETMRYNVETDENTGNKVGYGEKYPIFDCTEDELEIVNNK